MHIDSLLNCTLPWRSKRYLHKKPLCSQAREYDQYLFNRFNYRDPDSLKNIAKCYPRCIRYQYTIKLFLKEIGLTSAGITNYVGKTWGFDVNTSNLVQFEFFYGHYEMQVREHVYDYTFLNLVSDFGGWLGLLLGYSILGFYDTLVLILGNVKKTMTQKRHLATTPNKTTYQKPDEMIKTSKAIQVDIE